MYVREVTAEKIGRRVLVIGSSGSGKSTLGAYLARTLNLPFVELDSLFHGPNWCPASDEEFLRRVALATAEGQWVVDGNYSKVRELTYQRAESIVWLDLSFPVVFSRMVRRTFRRCYRKEVLWNGNRERLWTQLFTKDSLFWWVITTYRRKRRQYAALLASEHGENMIRLRSPAEVREFMSLVALNTDKG